MHDVTIDRTCMREARYNTWTRPTGYTSDIPGMQITFKNTNTPVHSHMIVCILFNQLELNFAVGTDI